MDVGLEPEFGDRSLKSSPNMPSVRALRMVCGKSPYMGAPMIMIMHSCLGSVRGTDPEILELSGRS